MTDKPTDDEMADFQAAMDRVKAVRGQQIEKPGGPGCVFPHCACNLPWTTCEKDPRN